MYTRLVASCLKILARQPTCNDLTYFGTAHGTLVAHFLGPSWHTRGMLTGPLVEEDSCDDQTDGCCRDAQQQAVRAAGVKDDAM